MGTQGKRFVLDNFDWKIVTKKICDFIDECRVE